MTMEKSKFSKEMRKLQRKQGDLSHQNSKWVNDKEKQVYPLEKRKANDLVEISQIKRGFW